MTVIREIAVWDLRPGFKAGPYAMSHAVMTEIRARIVRLRAAAGGEGWGEIIYGPAVPGARIDAHTAAEPDWLSAFAGRPADDVSAFVRRAARRGPLWRAAAFGLETAVLDMRARAQGAPLSDLLGGAAAAAADSYFSVSEKTADAVRARIRGPGRDHRVVQLKLGVHPRAEDVRQIQAALEELRGDRILLADANGGWTVDEAAAVARTAFAGARVPYYLEEPCRTYAENCAAAARTGAPVMVDQCVADVRLAEQAVKEKTAAAVCVKPAYLGGLNAGRRVRDLCAEHGVKMRIDGPWSGDIATAAALHLALGAPPELLIAGCDLREPLDLRPPLGGAVPAAGGKTAPPPGPGLGFTPAEPALGPPAAVYTPKA